MKLISRISAAAVLPIVVWLAACSPGATSAPAAATTAPVIATSVPAVATSAPAVTTNTPAVATTAPAIATTAPTVAASATAAATNTSAPANTPAPTLTIAPVASATGAAATPGITPTGAVISGTGGTAVVALTIKGFLFKPDVQQVKVGTTVTWTNMDDINHSVTNGTPPTPGGAFDSGFFTLGQSRSFTFMQPGDYAYFCKRHNSMTGIVRVVP